MKRLLPILLCLLLPVSVIADSKAIREDIFAAIDRNPDFGRYELSITVRQGFVTLEGEVGSEESKRFVEDVAKGESGVKEVRNFISVNSALGGMSVANEADKKLVARVLSVLRRDAMLSAGTYEVKAQQGSVTLSGTVPQPSAISRAGSVVQSIEGVASVTNQLEVAPGISDDEIANQFRAALKKNGIDENDVQISVHNGEVTLIGDAKNFRDIDQLLSIALMTPGVLNVRSEMTVRGAPYSTQHWKN